MRATRTILSPIAFAAVAGLFSYAAQAGECDPLPDVPWWSSSHADVIKLVNTRHDGKWNDYIDQWKNYQTKMQRILGSGGAAVVKSQGLRLEGQSLSDHIKQIKQRIGVMECLKDATKSSGDENLEKFETAAGGDMAPAAPAAAKKQVQVAEVSENGLDVEVTARCEGKLPIFQITNLGDKWPRLATVAIFGTEDRAMVTQRRIRLANSQQMTFKVRGKLAEQKKELGISVQPSWFERKFTYDARISCR